MIQFFLMLFGLALPNTDANTATANDGLQTVNVQNTQAYSADTGGDTIQIPIKK